jgi:hypothetical protein
MYNARQESLNTYFLKFRTGDLIVKVNGVQGLPDVDLPAPDFMWKG